MQDVTNRGNERAGERAYENSVISFQFLCKPKTGLKNSLLIFKKLMCIKCLKHREGTSLAVQWLRL